VLGEAGANPSVIDSGRQTRTWAIAEPLTLESCVKNPASIFILILVGALSSRK
jgi:hypothetical protein